MSTKPSTNSRRLRAAAVAVAAGGALLLAPSAVLAAEGEGEGEGGESASGTIKIEEVEFNDPDNPNEVKAGCDFRIDFFGFDEQTVPVTFTLAEPSGDDSEVGDVVAERQADLEAATGSDMSGSLDVDITDDLSNFQPAQAEDFDYKVRVDVVVKESEGGNDVTKSANLFLDCPEAAAAATAANTTDGGESTTTDTDDDTEETVVPQGGVDTGGNPADSSPAPLTLALLAAALLTTGTWVARRAVTTQQ